MSRNGIFPGWVRIVRRIVFHCGIICLALAASFAGAAAVADDWSAGKQAFATGDFASALVHFERAREAGLDSPAVHYNIGVTQFRLGRYGEASESFRLIARRFPAMRGLAEYNLGLVARRLGNDADARAHFLRAWELSPADRKLRVLASRRLRELQPQARTASRWSGAVGVRAGNDDNVALLDESGLSTGTTTDSPLVDAFLTIAGPWSGGNGFRVHGSAYLVRYPDAGDFDQSGIRGGTFYEWQLPDWRLQFGFGAGATALGGDAFDRKIGGRLRVIRYLGGNAQFDVQVTHDEVSEGDSVFAGIAGFRQTVDARYLWSSASHRVRLRFQFENNNRDDPGVSPERRRFSIDYRFEPERGFGAEAAAELRSSDYDDLAIPRT